MTEKQKSNRGGSRPGAGRPSKLGCPTTVMRVPSYMKDRIETLVRVQAEYLLDEAARPVGYLVEEEEKNRKGLVQDLEDIISYEKKRLARAYQMKLAEEENKRQLRLFDGEL